MSNQLGKFQHGINHNFRRNDIILLLPYSLLGSLIYELLVKITKPRGLSNDDTVNFFHAWCADCFDKKDNKVVDHTGTMLLFKEVQSNTIALSGSEVVAGCEKCGSELLGLVLHSLTEHEKDDLFNHSRLSIAKKYDAIKTL